MSHEDLWARLREEIYHLINQEVKSIDPRIVITYMGFLEEIEEVKDAKETSIQKA